MSEKQNTVNPAPHKQENASTASQVELLKAGSGDTVEFPITPAIVRFIKRMSMEGIEKVKSISIANGEIRGVAYSPGVTITMRFQENYQTGLESIVAANAKNYPRFVEEVIGKYGSEVELRRINGGSLGTGLGYYEVNGPEPVEFSTNDPALAASRFVLDALHEFVVPNFDLLQAFGDPLPPEFAAADDGDDEAGDVLNLPASNLGMQVIEDLRTLLRTYYEKLNASMQ